MSRFELGGGGVPIPNIALPDPNLSADLPVQSLVLENGVPFEKIDWVALGYTHYEVWCVGAAGGQGASVGDVHNLRTVEHVTMPDWLWEQDIAFLVNQYAGQGITSFPVYEFSTVPGHTGEVVVRYISLREKAIEELERTNPDHLIQVNNFHDPFVSEFAAAVLGGGGGGGGLHVVSGELAQLPDSVAVTVGAEGSQASAAQIISPDPYDPFATMGIQSGYYLTHPDEWQRFLFTNKWPPEEERTFLLPPQPGQDGGYSAFGDICMASGGRGGGPSIVWVDGVRMFASHGGQGGSGGRIEAGGGADGSTSSSAPGKDGVWDGTIGTGGGGGRGGWAEIKPNTLDYAVYISPPGG